MNKQYCITIKQHDNLPQGVLCYYDKDDKNNDNSADRKVRVLASKFVLEKTIIALHTCDGKWNEESGYNVPDKFLMRLSNHKWLELEFTSEDIDWMVVAFDETDSSLPFLCYDLTNPNDDSNSNISVLIGDSDADYKTVINSKWISGDEIEYALEDMKREISVIEKSEEDCDSIFKFKRKKIKLFEDGDI